jgi:hypothetical protein
MLEVQVPAAHGLIRELFCFALQWNQTEHLNFQIAKGGKNNV